LHISETPDKMIGTLEKILRAFGVLCCHQQIKVKLVLSHHPTALYSLIKRQTLLYCSPTSKCTLLLTPTNKMHTTAHQQANAHYCSHHQTKCTLLLTNKSTLLLTNKQNAHYYTLSALSPKFHRHP
jgi:hypothetical protein